MACDQTRDMAVQGKAVVHCSNDPVPGGVLAKMNPEGAILSAVLASGKFQSKTCKQRGERGVQALLQGIEYRPRLRISMCSFC